MYKYKNPYYFKKKKEVDLLGLEKSGILSDLIHREFLIITDFLDSVSIFNI